jgi:hypothetical protein
MISLEVVLRPFEFILENVVAPSYRVVLLAVCLGLGCLLLYYFTEAAVLITVAESLAAWLASLFSLYVVDRISY